MHLLVEILQLVPQVKNGEVLFAQLDCELVNALLTVLNLCFSLFSHIQVEALLFVSVLF
jgi:hypothetical protein